MTRKERDMSIGLLINKFHGDPNLFIFGIDYYEEKTGKPNFGLIQFYTDILIDSQDSAAVQEDKRVLKPVGPKTINIAVLELPVISNFADIEGLEREQEVVLNYLISIFKGFCCKYE